MGLRMSMGVISTRAGGSPRSRLLRRMEMGRMRDRNVHLGVFENKTLLRRPWAEAIELRREGGRGEMLVQLAA